MPGESFFTLDSFGTVAGAAGVIIIVTNTLRRVTGWNSPVAPFIISLLTGFFIAGSLANALHSVGDHVLAFVNSCLLFCTATGGQEVAVAATQEQKPPGVEKHAEAARERLPYFSSWLGRS
ncbi:hypothetical protein [Rhizobium sp. WYJ-E13]|uniref:hypothetical protein n=1 Tax=Rhizobium sp. WYJ-E13 TaxID=2849093 RepID=UPI001C1F03DA|nr:hypothetical protein [Rhizobium sp. WYJ-E13]QWW71374.1 hypothetical protein KQ933_22220 [Rhizobium sp. WYJ-E13]